MQVLAVKRCLCDLVDVVNNHGIGRIEDFKTRRNASLRVDGIVSATHGVEEETEASIAQVPNVPEAHPSKLETGLWSPQWMTESQWHQLTGVDIPSRSRHWVVMSKGEGKGEGREERRYITMLDYTWASEPRKKGRFSGNV